VRSYLQLHIYICDDSRPVSVLVVAMPYKRSPLWWSLDAAGLALSYFNRSFFPAMQFRVNHFAALVLYLQSSGVAHIYVVML